MKKHRANWKGPKPPCPMENCDGTAMSHQPGSVCTTCYSAARYHTALGVAHIYKYKHKLVKFMARAEAMSPHRGLKAVAGGRR